MLKNNKEREAYFSNRDNWDCLGTIPVQMEGCLHSSNLLYVKKIKGYGCPLIVQVHKKYPQYRPFSIQRVLRETRAGILEPGEALDLIRTIWLPLMPHKL